MPSSNALLSRHLSQKRIAPTYLLSGGGSAQRIALALEFAQALNCERERGFEGCDCSSCRKIARRIHPDVRWLGEEEENRSLKIEEVRALLHEASLKPFEGRWKVFTLVGAERLTVEAANAFLKTLEEPPEHSVFLLLVESKAQLLETVQSRAFEIRLPPTPEKEPRENPMIQLLHEKGWEAFFEGVRTLPRDELDGIFEALMFYLRNRCVSEFRMIVGARFIAPSRKHLEALDLVYEARDALEANVNLKLVLTHLAIRVGNL